MSDIIVALQHLSRHFRDQAALLEVTLDITRGRVFGLVGENGAGKTTLIKHLLGLYSAQVGTVRVFGSDPVRDPAAVLSRIGYLSEDRDLPEWMRVRELLSYTKAFYPRWDDRYAAELLLMFDLPFEPEGPHVVTRPAQRGLGLLVALAHRPELLILDEPSSGLDPGARQDILAAIVRTIADEGRTVLFSSHLLHEVQRVADNVAMLHQGRLVLNEPLDDLLARHRLVTLRFPQACPAQPALPGALWWSGEGAEWTCLCDGELTRLKEAAAAAGAAWVEERAPSLEEIFLARTKVDRRKEAEA